MKNKFSFGLIGFPLAHSLSPQIHAAALRHHHLSGEYRLISIPPLSKGSQQLRQTLSALRDGRLNGLNVTIPHKTTLVPLLDELTPAARTIGAVNTIWAENGHLFGDNTDAPAFWSDLHAHLPELSAENRTALVLGAGGAARAVVYALFTHGWQSTVWARSAVQSAALAKAFAPACRPIDSLRQIKQNFTVVVHCTPVGMHPHVSGCVWPDDVPFPPDAVIYDLVYNPNQTEFLRRAALVGHQTFNGMGMLVEQAALAFERWSGLPAPRQAMRAACKPTITVSE